MNKKNIIIGFVIIFLIVIVSSVASANLNDNITAAYNLDGDATDSAGTNDGTNNGATFVSGKIDQAASFDGVNDKIVISSDTSLNFGTGDFTLNFWIKSFASDSTQYILDKKSGSLGYDGVGYMVGFSSENFLSFSVGDGTHKRRLDTTSNYAGDNEWQMFTLVWDKTNDIQKIYYNNNLENSQTIGTFGSISSTNNMLIGVGYTNDEWINADIDAVNIYNRALTSTEVSELYNNNDGIQYPFQNNFKINANNIHTNESLSNFYAIINNTQYNSKDQEIITDIPINTTNLYNITVGKTDWYSNEYINYNISNQTTLIANLSSKYAYLNVNATDINDNYIQNLTATAISYNSSYTYENTTTNYITKLKLNWTETYNISVDAPLYALYNNNKNIYIENFSQDITIENLYKTNTINFLFKNETNNNPVTNVEVDLISDEISYNYTTGTDSNLTVSLIEPSDYNIVYNSDGYIERSFSFTLTNRSFNNLTLYLVEKGSADNITATVYDELGDEVEGATIEVLKYNKDTNSYKLVSQRYTNWQGITNLNLFKNNVYYKFRIYYDDVLKLTTNPTYIYQDSINFQIKKRDIISESYFSLENINYQLIYNNNTGNVKFEYSDPTGTEVEKACLKIQKTQGITTTNYNSSCIDSQSGTILVPISIQNNTRYTARAYVTISGEELFLDSIVLSGVFEKIGGKIGLFLILLVTITLSFTGLWNPVVAIVLTPIPLLLGSLIGFVDINTGIIIFFEIIAIIVAMTIGKRS
ncbi:MAG: LamG domain-containing protein [Candidatus Izemoplasmatales bacterium]